MIVGLALLFRWFGRALTDVYRRPETRGLTLLVAAVVGVGTVFYRLVEDFGWLDSAYFTVITLTTVGYGDLAPTTAPGKLFTTVYVLVGVGLIVSFGAALAGALLTQRPGASGGTGPE